jgi:serine/threonine-protein kinase RsbW
MANKKIKHFIIENQVNEITLLAEEVEKLSVTWGLNQSLAMNINLVIEEAVTNIIFYAFTDDKKHQIKITISIKNNKLTIKIADDGIPFDPLLHKKPDITSTAEERAVGGLGIFLISQMMDEIHYTRDKNQNILTLTKSI